MIHGPRTLVEDDDLIVNPACEVLQELDNMEARVTDIEKYIDLACTEGGYSRLHIVKLLEHFAYGINNKVIVLNQCTWSVNHGGDALLDDASSSENVLVTEVSRENDKGEVEHFYQGTATRDIAVGDEFYMDYRRFVIPDFYVRFVRKMDGKMCDVLL